MKSKSSEKIQWRCLSIQEKFLNITIFKGAMSREKVYYDNKLFTLLFLSIKDKIFCLLM